ncbi:MAG: hypothetical protein Q7T14_01925 [Aestuariivirga sp.]|nr:hypothetical protein [Aestuariivirga sp.]
MVHIPIFRSPEESTQMYVLCGRIALYWGPVELGIEGLLVRLRNNLKYGISKNSFLWSIPFPISFSRKVSEIKVHLKSSPKYAEIELELLPLLSRCKWIHDIRTHVVHSICQGTNLDGKLMFGRSDQNKGKSYTEKQFGPEELENVAIEMLHLVDKLNDMFNRLSNPALR